MEPPATPPSHSSAPIFVSSDHAGFVLREKLVRHLAARQDLRLEDRGPSRPDPVDYPDEAAKVARLVRDTPGARGILVCGSGIGMSIAANKVPGVRAVDAWSLDSARLSRQHNDTNVLCLGERLLSEEDAYAIVDTWLATPFDGGRHGTRVAKIAALESSAGTSPASSGEPAGGVNAAGEKR
jgi:RpiB/LacA/LacB family sugar-phosphate isomerase